MYSVVGCDRCSALWVVEGHPETTECPRCRTRHRFETRKKFVETEDVDHARNVRTTLLAEREGAGDADVAYSSLESETEAAGMTDEAYLDAAGVDPSEVAEAGANAGVDTGGSGTSRSRREVVFDALRDLERPTEAEVIEYATEADVPARYVREALSKLVERGAATETDGEYRLL